MTTALESTFIAPESTVAGLVLRPLTAGTLILLKQTKNPLLTGSLTEDKEFHVAAFIYIHSGDPRTVRKAAASDTTFREAVLEFADSLSVADFAKAAGQVKDICEKSVIGMNYEVEGGGGNDHPNG